jgi:hypothetical protein
MSTWWSWVLDQRGVRRGGEKVYVLRRGATAVAQLVLPLPYRGNDLEHLEATPRWTPVVLAGYPALGLSGAADPLEASVMAWLTPFGEAEWELMKGAGLPGLGLSDGTLLSFPGVPWSAPSWPRSAG